MARNTKKKLAIFAGTSKCLIYAEAKYCASEMPGEIKYYECPRTEYCCGIGCCVSPGLHFHHLWYYWILVIIMFLVCSGGGWWYRYWLQGRYRAAASAIPTRVSNSRAQNSLRGGTMCQGQRARITYNSARNTVLLHRMWKGPQRNGAIPSYTSNNATTSTHYQNMSVMLNDANCPYYQLYGPPPSYETVMAQTRGKVSNPASPESTNARSSSVASNATNSNVSQCFSYTCNLSTGLNNTLDQNTQYSNGDTNSRQLERREGIPFVHFPQYCSVTDGTIRQNVCLPFVYREQQFVPRDTFSHIYQTSSMNCVPYPLDKSNTSNANQSYRVTNTERYTMVECTAGSSREQEVWDDRSISKVHNNQIKRNANERMKEKNLGEEEEHESAIGTSFSSLFKVEGSSSNDSKSIENWLESFDSELTNDRRIYGGSLKITGKYADKERLDKYSVQRAFSKILPHSCDGLINTEPASIDMSHNVSSLEGRANVSASSFQSNPSNNVILKCFVSDNASLSVENIQKFEQSLSRPVNTSTNSDLESKYRLDRSKSLD
ncbi:uncharacterized protein LOC107999914 isoform X2 [Apis cerana]|uniref:uncharacterized protein LOC107999914 isoform X2 n=1 Tax=Apis cerana TaxID=7461 RepID=UPI002B23C5E3|nr:uncharacterized protein LOC107999914 isoform X2 [Apis cerana]